MTAKPLIEQLRYFIDNNWGSKLRLAIRLGYSSTTAIDNWFTRGNIPAWQQDRVKAFIKQKGKKA